MSLFLSVGVANAAVRQQDFFDFERATRYWTTVQTEEQFEAMNAPCLRPDYVNWQRQFVRRPSDDHPSLAKNPKAEAWKACWDFDRTYDRWLEIYSMVLSASEKRPWNQNTKCGLIRMMNYFTHQCNDLPDWRRPEDRERDARVLAGRTCQDEEIARAEALYSEYKASGGDAGMAYWQNYLFPKAIKSKCWQ